ncbi:hypothetical protein [Jatrophihabitans endophyticus]|uniref:hypothetical protein n=1 Tax=Jatrophihabitans endophyticus TaxID=1206085 RepID=UPI001A046074|nr:hypothetical protein [Jatrophihabitans endophyticus]MBE7186679.1 hypothetical protein [Jatrophihabitans endophyticus]
MTALRTGHPTVTRPGSGVRVTVLAVLRLAGAGLLATNAGIHADLWNLGYRSIPTIGPLFLLDVIAASVLTLAVLGAPRRLLWVVAATGALLEVGTVAGLYLATKHSLFGFTESTRAYLYGQSVWTEIAGTVVLAVLAALARRWGRTGSSGPWW